MSTGSMKRGPEEDAEGPTKKPRGEKYELRLLLPSKVAGSIIGKAGANIKKLRADNNAVVRLPDCSGPERVMTILTETIEELQSLLDQTFFLMTEEAVTGKQPSSDADDNVDFRFLIHSSIAGVIIGTGGSNIKEIRDVSGASVRVYQMVAPGSSERVVSIQGPFDKTSKALKKFLEFAFSTEVRGQFKKYDPFNFDVMAAPQYGGYGSKSDMKMMRPQGPPFVPGRGGMRGGFGGPPMRGAPFRGGRGGGFGGAPGGFSGMGRGGFRVQSEFMRKQGLEMSALDEPGEKETSQVTIPKDVAGAIIGPRGERIRQIRADSRCTISIGEAEPGSSERIITIEGTSQQIQMAQFLLQTAVRENSASGPPGRGRY